MTATTRTTTEPVSDDSTTRCFGPLDVTRLARDRRVAVDDVALADARALETTLRAAPDASAAIEILRERAERFGDRAPGEPLLYDRGALEDALERLEPQARRDLQRAAADIASFARAQRESIQPLAIERDGLTCGQELVPMRAAGCYAPGGRHPLPSSVLMTAIPARVAGVERVIVASPRPSMETLAAAAIAGADALLAIGGAAAILALAEGIGVERVDAIVGPGNRWTNAAKALVGDRVALDGFAGPSELLVLADDGVAPAIVAADLLAQAEHDPDACVWLGTTDPSFARSVASELERRLESLPEPNRTSAIAACRNGGWAVLADDDALVAFANEIAPEHLEIMTRDADAIAARIRDAGALFIGAGAAEVLGDYGVGPNHTLPTGGAARRTAGLSIFSFLRIRTFIRAAKDAGASPENLERIARLARIEGLEAHARAAEVRLSGRAT